MATDAVLGAVGVGLAGKAAAITQRFVAGTGMKRIAALGRHGERSAPIKGGRETFQNSAGKTRITDGGAGTSQVHEVKNVNRINAAQTRQIADEAGFAASNGRTMVLHTRGTTDLGKAEALIKSGAVEHRILPNTASDGFRKGLTTAEAAGVGAAAGGVGNAGTYNTMCTGSRLAGC